jgi:phosphatidylglycerol lysyltransferase
MTRRWVFQLLVIGGLWFAVAHLTEVERLISVFRDGRWAWSLGAAGVQVLYFIVFTAAYQSAFDTVGIPSRVRSLFPVVISSIAVNVATPAAGFGGAALFIDDAGRRGYPAGRAAAGVLLALIADLTAFMLLLAAGLVVLFTQRALRAYEVVAAGALFVVVTGLAVVVLLGVWRPEFLRRVLSWVEGIQRRILRFFRRADMPAGGWAERAAAEFDDAAAAIAAHPARLARTTGLSLAAHLTDLACLYLLALAFHGPVGLGVLVAAYAMAILFWNISITPQGIGVVEGVTPLVFASLGMPIEQGTVITLAFRGLTFWLPMAAGFIILRRLRSFAAEVEAQSTLWGVRAASALVALTGIVNVVSAITPSMLSRVAAIELLPLTVRHGARTGTVLAGFALLVLAVSLWRRKRVAWSLTMLALAASVAGHLLKGLDYEEALLAAAAAVWLLSLRSHFQARSDPPSVRRGLWAAAAAAAFVLAYGTATFYLLDRHFTRRYAAGAALHQTLAMFVQYPDPALRPATRFGRYSVASIYAVSIATAAYALLMLLRPVLVRNPPSADERARARRVVEQYGRSSLARFTLFPDKWYAFSRGGSVTAFAVRGRVAVALGDPIGSDDDVGAAIEAFQDLCARNDWTAAYYQTLPDHLESYRAAGFHALHIGNEGIVPLQTFTLEGREGKTLRGAVNRLTKAGYDTILHEPPLSGVLVEELRRVSDEWLAMMHGAEKGFSLGWFEDAYIQGSPVMAVHGPDGRVTAFANIVPEYQVNEVTIDLMRRRAASVPGTMDFLFVRLLQWARGRGYATFNLGLSPLAGVGVRPDASPVEHALRYLYEHLNQIYSFAGLYAFKEKFNPLWSPRYLIHPGAALLPAIALAIIRADSGDRFLWDYTREFAGRARGVIHRERSSRRGSSLRP